MNGSSQQMSGSLMKYFTSDWHLGHEGSIKFMRRPFDSSENMFGVLSENMFSLPKGSDLYMLGDGAWNTNILVEFLRKKPHNIQLHWIKGNHDNRINFNSISKYLTSVSDMKTIKVGKQKIVLCHYPLAVWDSSHWNSWQLHGHIHMVSPEYFPIGKQINVNVEFHNYKPWSYDEIVEEMKNRYDNSDYLEVKRHK